MASQCSDNSTECLLRAILDAQSGYNWNPLTFAFTVAIGVLAFVVACLTVFQGTLAAGPGRTKASKKAIGDFAQYTTSWIDWRELRVRTTARVPFIKLPFLDNRTFSPRQFPGTIVDDVIAPKINSTDNADMESLNSLDSDRNERDNRGVVKSLDIYESPGFAATWANFLSRLPSGQYYLPKAGRIRPAHWTSGRRAIRTEYSKRTLLTVQTDYLPSEISAAPCTGTIASIIVLAAVMGCDEIDETSDTTKTTGNQSSTQIVDLVARSQSLQITFREHTFLGYIAVAQDFPSQETYKPGFTRGIGDALSLMDGQGVDRLTGTWQSWHSLRVLSHGSPAWPRAVPYSLAKFDKVAKAMCAKSKVWSNLDVQRIISALVKNVYSLHGSIWWHHEFRAPTEVEQGLDDYPSDRRRSDSVRECFNMDENTYVPALWDKEKAGLGWMAIMTWRFAPTTHPRYENLGPSDATNRPLLRLKDLQLASTTLEDLKTVEFRSTGYRPIFTVERHRPFGHAVVDHEKPFLILLPVVLVICTQFLEGGFDFQKLDFDQKCCARGALRHQLHEIDHFIIRHHPMDLRDFKEPQGHTRKLDTTMKPERKPAASLDEAWDSVDESDGFDALIHFRIVLMAAFLSTAADISPVMGTAIGKRIVQFI